MKISIEIDTQSPDDLDALARLTEGLCSTRVLQAFSHESGVVNPSTTKPRAGKRQTAAERTLEALQVIAEQDKAAGVEAQVTREATVRDLTDEERAKLESEKVAEENSAAIETLMPVSEEIREAADAKVTEVNPPSDAPTVEDTRSPEELLAAVREKAGEEGALYIRGILQKYGVKGLSQLSPAQMIEVLA
jgi:hypothetical protein